MHVSVMTSEVLEFARPTPGCRALEATAGHGGHTLALALAGADVIANDWDETALAVARQKTAEVADRVIFTRGAFSTLPERLRELGRTRFDIVLADLGVNREQLVNPERGLSFMSDGPLDMRLDRSRPTTAADLVNQLDEHSLADLIYRFGEERRSRQIARAITRARPIHTTERLASAVRSAVPWTENIHPATRTFMALRIAVNEELDEIESLLSQIPGLLKPGGRAVILTFHSLEDRLVKRKFLEFAQQRLGTVITKKVVTPTEEETRSNPAARSAKLRCFEKALLRAGELKETQR
jgi:16S rRNA (cytosine1402-N4)-methyltransferase